MARQKAFGQSSKNRLNMLAEASKKGVEARANASEKYPLQKRTKEKENVLEIGEALQIGVEPGSNKTAKENAQRKARYWKKVATDLRNGAGTMKEQIQEFQAAETQHRLQKEALRAENTSLQDHLEREIQMRYKETRLAAEERHIHKAEMEKIKKRLKRADGRLTHAVKRAKEMAQRTFLRQQRGFQRRLYTIPMRRILRLLVANGCSRSKAGNVLKEVAAHFGVKVRAASRRTVSRVVLEGYIASKMQIGYEIGQTHALTISADSTSNRGIDFEARHITMRVPAYVSGETTTDHTSKPKIRLLGIDTAAEHTSEASANGFTAQVNEAMTYFNQSPHAQRLKQAVRIQDFLRKLKGMNGDHASKEKCTAQIMSTKKSNSALIELGEESLASMDIPQLINYLAAWNIQKISAVGGPNKWAQLSASNQSQLDKKMMDDLLATLGRQEYAKLSAGDKHHLDLFIWSGCCMHKNENSFEGGNSEMKAEWTKLALKPPIALANKFTAAAVRQTLDPGQHHDISKALTDAEVKAIEQIARGGVKASALAGAIFKNKDHKKGQGKKHLDYFQTEVDPRYHIFPDTSNTRFGSHGDAAADLIQYLEGHIKYIEVIRLSKTTHAYTNIEYNVLQALKDIPTLTELCAMVLYSQSISKPYMAHVRGSNHSGNALDLGPFHQRVLKFVEHIIDNPYILINGNVTTSHVDATLDGKEWENPHAVKAVAALLPKLPHLKEITLSFFRGSLATWIRFTSEFAPGGLIDTSSTSEKDDAWMPPTNDHNESALGAYRVTIRGKPSMTLHQYNALAIFKQNDTQDFIDAIFTPEDHIYVMKEARILDKSGQKKIRRDEAVLHRVKVAEQQREKEAAQEAKDKATLERLSNIILLKDVTDVDTLTVPKLDEQISGFRHRNLPASNAVLPSKKDLREKYRKPQKQELVRKLILALSSDPDNIEPQDANGGSTSTMGEEPLIQDNWEAIEDVEMEDL